MEYQFFFDEMLQYLKKNQSGYLITLCDYARSSPQPKGALWFWTALNKQIGSLSSGCLEELLINLIKKNCFQNTPTFLLVHHLRQPGSQDDDLSFYRYQNEIPLLKLNDLIDEYDTYPLLPCGGSLLLLIEKINHFNCNIVSYYERLIAHLKNGEAATKKILFPHSQQKLALSNFYDEENKIYNDESHALFPSKISTTIPEEKKIISFQKIKEGIILSHELSIQHTLLIIGWNKVAYYVAHWATSLRFNVFICEPRTEKPASFLDNVTWLATPPDEWIQLKFGTKQNAIIVLSHDAKLDDLALIEAIETDAFYIGALGSIRTAEKRIERLTSVGISKEKLQRVKSPIGIAIPSKWPSEIAISILAELILTRKQNIDTL